MLEENNRGTLSHSSYSSLYKNRCNKAVNVFQEERRQRFLQHQKQLRQITLDSKRNISDLFTVEKPSSKPQLLNDKSHSTKNDYCFKWMQSEWFTDIPADFTKNWLCKFCPEGTRYLVVAEKGSTTCYVQSTRNQSHFRFTSNLPGGNRNTFNTFTILDCIYNANRKTYIVFDVLAWNSLALINSDAQFRFFWLMSRFHDDPNLQETTAGYRFKVMNAISAEHSEIQQFLSGCQHSWKYDGILFYHKEGLYHFGKTPLVGWLKTFMLPEMLPSINVVDLKCCDSKPENYVNIAQYLSEQKKMKKQKPKVKQSKVDEQMQVEEIEPDS